MIRLNESKKSVVNQEQNGCCIVLCVGRDVGGTSLGRYSVTYAERQFSFIKCVFFRWLPICQHYLLQLTRHPTLTRAALGSPAERAALEGGGVNIAPPANSRTSGRSDAGEAAFERSQRELSEGL